MNDYPTIPTREELPDVIDGFIAGVSDPDVSYGPNKDGYGKCVEAMWRSAYVAHEYVARELGVTGFQHSMSALTLLGALNCIDGPYILIQAGDALYPQYDVPGRLAGFLASEDVRKWLAEEAAKNLAAISDDFPPHPAVKALARRTQSHRGHWESIVAGGVSR